MSNPFKPSGQNPAVTNLANAMNDIVKRGDEIFFEHMAGICGSRMSPLTEHDKARLEQLKKQPNNRTP